MLGTGNECLVLENYDVSDVGCAEVRLDRFSIEQWNSTAVLASEVERLYLLMDARGTLCVNGAGACWRHRVQSNTGIWIPAGVKHELCNTGDALLRGIVFSAAINPFQYSSERCVSPQTKVIQLSAQEERNMVTFLTRTLVSGEDVTARVLLLSEVQTVLPGGYVPKHIHQARSEICYILGGIGVLTQNEQEFRLQAGEAAFIPSGTAHSMRNEEEYVLEYAVAQFVAELHVLPEQVAATEEEV